MKSSTPPQPQTLSSHESTKVRLALTTGGQVFPALVCVGTGVEIDASPGGRTPRLAAFTPRDDSDRVGKDGKHYHACVVLSTLLLRGHGA